MGKLRKEPKDNTLNSEAYKHIEALFLEALEASNDSNVTYDLAEDEDGATARNLFKLAARLHNVKGFEVQRPRNSNTLKLRFQADPGASRIGKKRASPAEISARLDAILGVISEKGTASRKDVCSALGFDAPQWNPAIKTLLEQGKVVRTGTRINARYSLA